MTPKDDRGKKPFERLGKAAQLCAPALLNLNKMIESSFSSKNRDEFKLNTPPHSNTGLEFHLEHGLQKFNRLNPITKDKVWITLCDIEETLPLPHPNKIEIPLMFRRTTKLIPSGPGTGSYRRDALIFLTDANVLQMYDIRERGVDGFVEIFLDVQAFKTFKAEVDKIYAPEEAEQKDQARTDPQADPTKAVYEVWYTLAREVLVNNVQVARLNIDSENDKIFSFLYQNPNKTFTIQELTTRLKGRPVKSLHKFVENVGFKGGLRKLFFDASKNSIRFHNPVTLERMRGLGMTWLSFSSK